VALNRASYRRVPDLYVVGGVLELLDGSVMWLQIMNPFEREEAQHDAAVVRSRLMLALKDSADSDEMAQVRSMYIDLGRDGVIAQLLESKKVELFIEVMDDMRTEDDWRERIEILQRNDDISTLPTEMEQNYLIEMQQAYALEVAKRLESAVMVDSEILEETSEESLYEQYRDWYLEQRGGTLGMGEYRLTEMWYACRACVASKTDGEWDHSGCEGHQIRVFESKDDVKHLPEKLQAVIVARLMELEMTEREAKN
jgi:hypothetical protein